MLWCRCGKDEGAAVCYRFAVRGGEIGWRFEREDDAAVEEAMSHGSLSLSEELVLTM